MIKCLIIDDELPARQLVASYVEKSPTLQIVESCKDAMAASVILKNNQVDLIFCDINMPHIDGISFISSLSSPPQVIFTTAYSEYAVEGFELNALDYLVKPFDFARFQKAIDRMPNSISDSIKIKADGATHHVKKESIFFVEGMKEYVRFNLIESPPLTTLDSMNRLSELLSPDFVRVHKSFIINSHHVKSIEPGFITLSNSNRIPIGRTYKELVNKTFA